MHGDVFIDSKVILLIIGAKYVAFNKIILF